MSEKERDISLWLMIIFFLIVFIGGLLFIPKGDINLNDSPKDINNSSATSVTGDFILGLGNYTPKHSLIIGGNISEAIIIINWDNEKMYGDFNMTINTDNCFEVRCDCADNGCMAYCMRCEEIKEKKG